MLILLTCSCIIFFLCCLFISSSLLSYLQWQFKIRLYPLFLECHKIACHDADDENKYLCNDSNKRPQGSIFVFYPDKKCWLWAVIGITSFCTVVGHALEAPSISSDSKMDDLRVEKFHLGIFFMSTYLTASSILIVPFPKPSFVKNLMWGSSESLFSVISILLWKQKVIRVAKQEVRYFNHLPDWVSALQFPAVCSNSRSSIVSHMNHLGTGEEDVTT